MSLILDRFVMKKDDTLPAFVRILKRQTSDNVVTVEDLTAVTSVTFNYSPEDGGEPTPASVVSRSVTVTDAANGEVTWSPIAADSATVGVNLGEFVVTYNTGGILRFPNGKDTWIEFCVVKNAG